MNSIYLQVGIEDGQVGLTECKVVIDSWLNSVPLEDTKTIKMNTYNYPISTKIVKLGRFKVNLTWNTQMGLMGLSGHVVSPRNEIGQIPVIIQTL